MEVKIVQKVSNKSNKPYKALELRAGLWSKLVFLSPFELEYVEKFLAGK